MSCNSSFGQQTPGESPQTPEVGDAFPVSRLLSLPREIRDMVIDYVLLDQSKTAWTIWGGDQVGSHRDPELQHPSVHDRIMQCVDLDQRINIVNLLLLNRQLRQETQLRLKHYEHTKQAPAFKLMSMFAIQSTQVWLQTTTAMLTTTPRNVNITVRIRELERVVGEVLREFWWEKLEWWIWLFLRRLLLRVKNPPPEGSCGTLQGRPWGYRLCNRSRFGIDQLQINILGPCTMHLTCPKSGQCSGLAWLQQSDLVSQKPHWYFSYMTLSPNQPRNVCMPMLVNMMLGFKLGLDDWLETVRKVDSIHVTFNGLTTYKYDVKKKIRDLDSRRKAVVNKRSTGRSKHSQPSALVST